MTKYLDLYHADIMSKVLVAFRKFNDALYDAEHGGLVELPEAVIKFGEDDYCRVFFHDGEAFVEPIYNPIRDIEDR